MKAHCIKVAIEKEYILNEYFYEDSVSLSNILALFEGKKVKYITTFTNVKEHWRILNSISKTLSKEDQFLQIKFRLNAFSNGLEIIENILSGNINKENIELLPDIIFSNNEQLRSYASNLGVLCLDNTFFNQENKVKLCIKKISEFLKHSDHLPYWKIRIEDRYLIKNIKNNHDAEKLIDSLNIKNNHSLIEIFYSGEENDYKGKEEKDFVDANERNNRIEILKKVGKNHKFYFYPNAGHDRYLCTNSALFIFGNSITSDKETHITNFPLIQYYNDYFKKR